MQPTNMVNKDKVTRINRDLQEEDVIDGKSIDTGLSNTLFQKGSELIRLYGESKICDRDMEIKIMCMASINGIGPAIHEIYNNGRVEEFLIGFKTFLKFTLSLTE